MTVPRSNKGTRDFSFTGLIDLGVSAGPDALHESWRPEIYCQMHGGEGLDRLKNTLEVTEKDLVWSGDKGAVIEEVTAITRMAEGRVKRVLYVWGVS